VFMQRCVANIILIPLELDLSGIHLNTGLGYLQPEERLADPERPILPAYDHSQLQ
jgi:hypothetical protein